MIPKNLRVAAVAVTISMLAACGGSDNNAGVLAGASSGAPNTGASTPQSTASAPKFKIDISAVQDVAGTYGDAGAYEKVTGTFSGEVDPADSANAIIQDLSLAPRNAAGMVEYRADFIMYKPKDMGKANGVLRYDAPNRGTPVAMDSYFASRGYVFLNTAWQGDVPATNGRVTLQVPVATNPDGSTITGPYRTELLPAVASADSLPLPGGAFNAAMQPYAPASLDNTRPGFLLTRRVNEGDPRQLVPASDWKFAKCGTADPFPGTADGASVCVRNGWDPAYMYELVYVAKDPKVMGLGLAAVRDAVSFFRHSASDADGVANPVAGAIRYALASGVSQAGAFLKTYVHLGFNQDLSGGKVFDGVFNQIGGRQNNVNTRFAVPGGAMGVRADHTSFGISGARAFDKDYVDDVAQRKGGIFTRCEATGTCPKFFFGMTGTEFWTSTVSPVLTDAWGTRDLAQPDNLRLYFYASSHHIIGLPSVSGTVAASFLGPAYNGLYQTNGNVSVVPVVKALYLALEEWVVQGTEPPASQVPRLDNATLVRAERVNFPAIPGMKFPGLVNTFPLLDWGSAYKPVDESGIATVLPPVNLQRDYAVLVPQVDADGNDIAGIRSLDVTVPTATNTGWNTTVVPGRIDQAGLVGSNFPLPKTEADRLSRNDPRASIAARYGNQASYVAALRSAADDLVAKRLMLRADADAAISAAAQVLP